MQIFQQVIGGGGGGGGGPSGLTPGAGGPSGGIPPLTPQLIPGSGVTYVPLSDLADVARLSSSLAAKRIIQHKHDEYTGATKRYRALYYVFRVIAGLSAGLLPFVIASHPNVATGLSIMIVIITAMDLVFNPKDKWQLYSRATDLLAVETLKREGSYAEYRSLIDIILKTETAALERLVSVDELIKDVRKT